MTSFFTFGAAVSVVGLLCTLLCSSSRIIYGMAMVGTLPKVFAKTSTTYGTPYVAILANSVAMACVLFLPFGALAEGEMWFYAVSTIMKFGALIQLRKVRAPLSTRAAVGLVAQPHKLRVVTEEPNRSVARAPFA